VRFVSVTSLFAINEVASLPALVTALETDESRRVQNRIAQGLADRGWAIPAELSPRIKASLPPGFQLAGDKVQKA